MSAHPPRVAVLVDTSTLWGRSAVKGIVDYIRTSNRWVLSIDWRGVHEQLRIPNNWRGEGIIARVTSRALARQIKALKIPAVNISWSTVPESHVPAITTDEQAIAQLAADHFLERGFRHFAYVGYPDQPYYVDHCGPVFAQQVKDAGCQYYPFKPRRSAGKGQYRLSKFTVLQPWLKKVPKPLAVFAWDAVRGRIVADACMNLGLKVPDEVSILVGYDDDLMCETSMLPLSGIDDRPEQVGRAAAETLDRLMRGEKPLEWVQRVAPSGIVARQSTDTLAYQDAELAAAMSFIRQHCNQSISVDDVLSVVSLSRRSLEQRFVQQLGRSPAAEIRRIHLQHAQNLLMRSQLSISKIAFASGFMHAEVMTRAFRRELNTSPTEFRKKFRPP